MQTSLSFKDRAKQAIYFVSGMGKGLAEAGVGLVKISILPQRKMLETVEQSLDLLRHPKQQAEKAYQQMKGDFKTLEKIWNHPKEEFNKKTQSISHAIHETWEDYKKPFQSSNPNQRAESWGKLTFDIGSLFIGTGEVKALVKAEEGLSILSKATRIEEAGLSILANTKAKILPAAEEVMMKGVSGFKTETLLSKIDPTKILALPLNLKPLVLKLSAPTKGTLRAAKFSQFWQRASLQETADKLIGKGAEWKPSLNAQKMEAINPITGIKVAYDLKGKYFTVVKENTKTGKFIYFDLNGNKVVNNYYLIKEDKIIFTGLSKDIKKGLSHFNNSDGSLPWK